MCGCVGVWVCGCGCVCVCVCPCVRERERERERERGERERERVSEREGERERECTDAELGSEAEGICEAVHVVGPLQQHHRLVETRVPLHHLYYIIFIYQI